MMAAVARPRSPGTPVENAPRSPHRPGCSLTPGLCARLAAATATRVMLTTAAAVTGPRRGTGGQWVVAQRPAAHAPSTRTRSETQHLLPRRHRQFQAGQCSAPAVVPAQDLGPDDRLKAMRRGLYAPARTLGTAVHATWGSLLGALALIAVFVALVSGDPAALATLVVVTVAVWVTATVRHLLTAPRRAAPARCSSQPRLRRPGGGASRCGERTRR